MAGSTIGTLFKVTTWGESHGEALGVVIDGCPSGIPLSEKEIQIFLDRRKPGKTTISTPRQEDDKVEILSGVFEGKTTGAPISMLVRNQSQRSKDYQNIAENYRPGHADYTFDVKYGFRDYRGGGRSSGRETIGRVAAGAIASKLLSTLGITLLAYTKAIGPIEIDPMKFNKDFISSTPTCMPDSDASIEAEKYMQQCMREYDSSGGVVECRINHVPAGLGEPVFDKLDASLAKALLSIGGVKAFEIGDGIKASLSRGSENNDNFIVKEEKISKATNHSGGVLGGISDGSELIVRAFFKPTPSIFTTQKTVNQQGVETEIRIEGRHDPVIVPRAVVVVESMCAITIVDQLLINMTSKLDSIQAFYQK